MRLKDKHINIGDLAAETYLNEAFPDEFPVWVSAKGIFYSNYSEDLLEVVPSDYTANQVALSRDGIFHMLPEGMFFDEYAFREARKKGVAFEPDKEHIFDFLAPFDTEFFNVTLGLDKEVRYVEDNICELLLESMYGRDGWNKENPFVRKTLPFLLHASVIRGDFPLMERMMSAITGFRTVVTPTTDEVLSKSGSKRMRPFVNVVFHIPNLSNSGYCEQYDILHEFVGFCAEWFFPAELEFDFSVRDEDQLFVLDEGILTLDYNTFL